MEILKGIENSNILGSRKMQNFTPNPFWGRAQNCMSLKLVSFYIDIHSSFTLNLIYSTFIGAARDGCPWFQGNPIGLALIRTQYTLGHLDLKKIYQSSFLSRFKKNLGIEQAHSKAFRMQENASFVYRFWKISRVTPRTP